MVLGLRTKSRRGTSIQADYIICVQEIKPWPPSHSLRSLRNVVLQWENGERNSGSIGPVVPSIGSVVGEGKIEFNESIKLSVALSRELSAKGGNVSSFQKNNLELNLFEPRRDKSVKGQPLGSAIVDLAEYATIKAPISISIPMNCKRSFRNTAQPVITLKIQLSEKNRNSSSSRESLSKQSSMDKDTKESVSALMNEEYAEEEAEIASFTDDDVSSHSSLAMSSCGLETTGNTLSHNDSVDDRRLVDQNLSDEMEDIGGRDSSPPAPLMVSNPSKPALNLASEIKDEGGISSRLSSVDLSYDLESHNNDVSSLSPECKATTNLGVSNGLFQQSYIQKVDSECKDKENGCLPSSKEDEDNNTKSGVESLDKDILVEDRASHANTDMSKGMEETAATENTHQANREENVSKVAVKFFGEKVEPISSNQVELARGETMPPHLTENSSILSSDPRTTVKSNGLKSITSTGVRLKKLNFIEGNEDDDVEDADDYSRILLTDKGKNDGSKNFSADKVKWVSREASNHVSNSKVRQLEQRVELLEGELQEAASLELSLYSIIAEHGSSTQKVHAPARRLSRLYTHALKQQRRDGKASAAKSIVSGLVLVAKACGHDVPRLTFWLSNSIVLRTIITKTMEDFPLLVSIGSTVKTSGFAKETDQKVYPLRWKNSNVDKKAKEWTLPKGINEWEDPSTFTTMLEKIEGWIFSRVIESIWWQILTPYMQSARSSECEASMQSKKNYGRKPSLSDQQQGNFSINLWKKAFRDACERICPVRAAGHECGCLSLLARLIMEQCVSRLDVAMFNAILRESDDDIPTDPISDPIGDLRVLPIPAGKTSFGAGAQLKNAIGNWSRWLTDLFGIDDDDSLQENDEHDGRDESARAFKSFNLLNALSDLLMLPKDMLLDRSIWREVCPILGAPMIRRILDTFVPDEFYSEPVSESLLEALESEDSLEDAEELIRNFPCDAVPIVYTPPSKAIIAHIIGDVRCDSQLKRSGSSVLRKGQTSDDELEELESPLTSIIVDNQHSPASSWKLKGTNKGNVVRFGLLRDVWRGGD